MVGSLTIAFVIFATIAGLIGCRTATVGCGCGLTGGGVITGAGVAGRGVAGFGVAASTGFGVAEGFISTLGVGDAFGTGVAVAAVFGVGEASGVAEGVGATVGAAVGATGLTTSRGPLSTTAAFSCAMMLAPINKARLTPMETASPIPIRWPKLSSVKPPTADAGPAGARFGVPGLAILFELFLPISEHRRPCRPDLLPISQQSLLSFRVPYRIVSP